MIGLLVKPEQSKGTQGYIRHHAGEGGAGKGGWELQLLQATSENEIDAAFTTLAELRAGALIIDTDLFFFGRQNKIRALAARHSVPAMYFIGANSSLPAD